MRKIKKNKQGQAVVEYVLVMAVLVIVVVSGFSYLKCHLHTIWIKLSCDILYPYPYYMATELEPYCTPVKENCFQL